MDLRAKSLHEIVEMIEHMGIHQEGPIPPPGRGFGNGFVQVKGQFWGARLRPQGSHPADPDEREPTREIEESHEAIRTILLLIERGIREQEENPRVLQAFKQLSAAIRTELVRRLD